MNADVVIVGSGVSGLTSATILAKRGIEALRRRKAPGKALKLSGQQLRRLYRLVVGVDPRPPALDIK